MRLAVTFLALTFTAFAAAQTTSPTNSCSTDNTSCTRGTNSDSAQLITSSGTASISPEDTATLKQAIESSQHARAVADAADANLQTVQKMIAAKLAAPASGPYQIVTDFSTTLEQVPPVEPPPVEIWTKVADEGDVVLIKAGTTVRYGAPKGAPNLYAQGGILAADAWNPPMTFTKDMVLTVDNSSFPPDPMVGTAKELDQLGTTITVARTTAK